MTGHGPDAATFDKAARLAEQARDVPPPLDTTAFMFETRAVIHPTRQVIDAAHRDVSGGTAQALHPPVSRGRSGDGSERVVGASALQGGGALGQSARRSSLRVRGADQGLDVAQRQRQAPHQFGLVRAGVQVRLERGGHWRCNCSMSSMYILLAVSERRGDAAVARATRAARPRPGRCGRGGCRPRGSRDAAAGQQGPSTGQPPWRRRRGSRRAAGDRSRPRRPRQAVPAAAAAALAVAEDQHAALQHGGRSGPAVRCVRCRS